MAYSPWIPIKAKLHCMGTGLLYKILHGLENDQPGMDLRRLLGRSCKFFIYEGVTD